jgi:hypothetical protein
VRKRPPLLALVLAMLLFVWEPLTLAATASRALSRLASYGAPAWGLLAYRALVAGLGMAAGRALWQRDPEGPRLARWWALAHAVGLVLTFSTPYFPSNRLPGTTGPTLSVLLAVDAAWWAWLGYSSRVRQAYGL